MCEFKVYVKEESDEKKLVAKGIVTAKQQGRNVILMDITGRPEAIENVSIESVSTMNQELILIR